MINYVVFNNTTGQIVRTGFVATTEQLAIQAQEGETAVQDTADELTEYYDVSGSPVTKTTRPLLTTANSWSKTTFDADGSDGATFGSSLPNPTMITIEGPFQVSSIYEQTETTGSITVKATVAGTYTLTMESFPYQTYTAELTAE